MKQLLHLLCLLLPLCAQGQLYSATLYDESDGLKGNIILSIAQAEDQQMWFLTQLGICRYRGTRWNCTIIEATLNYENQLYTLPDNSVWLPLYINKYVVFRRYKGDSYQDVIAPFTQAIPDNYKYAVQWVDGKAELWAYNVTTTQLAHYKNEKWDVYNIGLKGVYSLKSTNNELYLLAYTRIYKLDGKALTPAFEYLAANEHLLTIAVVDGKEYLLTTKHLREQEKILLDVDLPVPGRHFERYYAPNIGVENQKIYFNTPYRLLKLSLTSKEIEEISIGSETVIHSRNAFLIDQNSSLWIGSSRGLAFVPNLNIKVLKTAKNTTSSEISTVKQFSDGSLLVGGNGSFSFIGDQRRDKTIYNTAISPEGRINDILITGNRSAILAANQQGLGLYNDGKISWIPPPNNQYFTSAKEFNGDVFISTTNQLWQLGADKKLVSLTDSLSYIRRLKVADNKLWLLGIDSIRWYTPATNTITSILNDVKDSYDIVSHKGLLILGGTHGLTQLKDGKISPPPPPLENIARSAYSLLSLSDKTLVIGTDYGIYILQSNNTFKHITTADGLIGNEINREGMLALDESTLIVGTDKGASIVDIESLLKNYPKVVPHIQQVYTNDKEIPPTIGTSLAYSSNAISFIFSSTAFTSRQSLIYRYKLNGLETNWSYTTESELGPIRYTNLDPGTYNFELQVKQTFGNWSPSVATASIVIEQPVYRTWWFIVIAVAFWLLLLYGMFTLLTHRRQEQKLVRRVNIATAEVRLKQKLLEEQNSELTKVNAELDSFVYSVSHDLRAPLTSVMGVLQLIKLESDPTLVDLYLEKIDESVKRLDTFIGDILNYSRNARLAFTAESIDFENLINDTVKDLSYINSSSKIDLQVAICNEGNYLSDTVRWSIMLKNLLSNAYKFAGSAANIPVVSVSVTTTDDVATLIVEDNGPGIPPDHIGSIFKMFYRASTTVFGSGLGLYIVADIVEKLNGSISAQNKKGGGAKFTLIIPARACSTKPTPEEQATLPHR